MTRLTFTPGATAEEINRAIREADAGPLEILLAAGVHTLDGPIKILRDDVTLRGEGVGETILKVAAAAGGNAQAVQVYSADATDVSALRTTTLAGASRTIALEDASGIAAGMVIRIEQENTQAWFDATGNTHLDAAAENAAGHVLRQMLAEVTAVDGNEVTLASATPYAFGGTDEGGEAVARVSIPDLLEGVEIADFSVTSDLPGTPDKDDFTNNYDAYDRPANNAAIEVTGARGLSLHDIRAVNTVSTAFDLGTIYGATIDDLEAAGSFNKGPDGNGYAFVLKTAFNNRLSDLIDRDMRHGLLFGPFTAEHYNSVHVISTNRDINFHGSPDSGNRVLVAASMLDFPQFEGSKSAVQAGNREIHPRSTIAANDVTFQFLSGSHAQDVVHGHDGGSQLWGNQNGDALHGGDGADVLSGGIDNDLLEGGGGPDRFIFRRAYEQDRITDFETGPEGDTLDLSRTGIAGREGLSSRQVGADTVLSLGGGDSLTLEGIDRAAFEAMTIRFDATPQGDLDISAWGSDLGFSGGGGDDRFALRPGNFTNGSRPDLLGWDGTDTLALISGSIFDASQAGRTAGIDVLDVTATPRLAQLTLTPAFAAQGDAGHVTIRHDETGVFLKTPGIEDWNAVRLSGRGTVLLSSDGAMVSAGTGAIDVIGGANTDSIKGRGGDDRIDGGGGRDNLRGGGGDDAFVFTRGAGSASADIISDFGDAPGNDDRFELESDLYTGLYEGWLSRSRFRIVSDADPEAGVDGGGDGGVDGGDRILYDRANGTVYFDRDGSGDEHGRLRIAELEDGTPLSHQDFLIL